MVSSCAIDSTYFTASSTILGLVWQAIMAKMGNAVTRGNEAKQQGASRAQNRNKYADQMPSTVSRIGTFIQRTTAREPATFWAFGALSAVVVAFAAFNFGAVIAPEMQTMLHASKGQGRHLFSLQQQYVRLERDISIFKDQKSLQDAKIALLQDKTGKSSTRLTQIENNQARQLAALNNPDPAILTGSIDGVNGEIVADQPQLRVITEPLVADPSNLAQPLPAELSDEASSPTAAPNTDAMVSNDVRPPQNSGIEPQTTPFALDLGVQESEASARAYWLRLSSRHGTAFLGLKPKIAEAQLDGLQSAKRLVVGPLETISESLLLCAQLETRNISCETGLFEGKDL